MTRTRGSPIRNVRNDQGFGAKTRPEMPRDFEASGARYQSDRALGCTAASPAFSPHVRRVVERDDPWDSTGMTRRSSPVETALTSRVEFPSALFSLEYDEIFPYERFAHNLLRHAVEALHAKDLPPNISIEFVALPERQYPWTLNSRITVGTDSSGNASSFRFVTPEMVPAIVYVLVATALHDFFDATEFRAFSASPDVFAKRLKQVTASVNLGLKNYSLESFAITVRGIYERLGLNIWRLHLCWFSLKWREGALR